MSSFVYERPDASSRIITTCKRDVEGAERKSRYEGYIGIHVSSTMSLRGQLVKIETIQRRLGKLSVL